MVFVVALSAVAWAWHVDLPTSTDGSVKVAALDHGHVDNGDVINRCDHCCHAGAHLTALVAKAATLDFDTSFLFAAAVDARLTSPKTDPPYIPPIA